MSTIHKYHNSIHIWPDLIYLTNLSEFKNITHPHIFGIHPLNIPLSVYDPLYYPKPRLTLSCHLLLPLRANYFNK